MTDSASRDPDAFGEDGERHEVTNEDRVQCPNCCRLAYVTSRNMGLLFYRCALCGSVGTTPDDMKL